MNISFYIWEVYNGYTEVIPLSIIFLSLSPTFIFSTIFRYDTNVEECVVSFSQSSLDITTSHDWLLDRASSIYLNVKSMVTRREVLLLIV
jgi:hypothetical protein